MTIAAEVFQPVTVCVKVQAAKGKVFSRTTIRYQEETFGRQEFGQHL